MSACFAGRPRGLIARLYLFSIAHLLVVAFAVPWVSHLVLRPPGEPRGLRMVAEHIVTDVAQHRDEPAALRHALERVRTDLHGELTLYDAQGRVLATNIQPPLRPPPGAGPGSSGALHPLAAWGREAPDHAAAWHSWLRRWFFLGPPPPLRFVVPLAGDAGGYGVYGHAPPPRAEFSGAAWGVVLALVASAFASVLLARSFALPLARLAATARAFGGGDHAARTGLARGDEFGEVGHAFDEMADRVARLIRLQKELLANVSHELRTPLARIRVALDIAAEGDTDTAREALADLGEDLGELEQLVSDVLENARLELRGEGDGGASPRLHREPVDLGALLERAAGRFAARHPSRTLELEVRGAAVTLEADGPLLRRALDNVLDNAAKYSDAEEPVLLRARCSPQAVDLEVVDRGIGIGPEDLARVGTPFFRTDQSRARTTGGIGLGLSLARRIADAHGGVLRVESERGVGTRVRITVPR